MIGRMRDGWRRFEASKAGHRFRDRYRRHRRSGQGRSILRKVFVIVGGAVVAVASLLLAPLPGPGWGTFLVGLIIIAGELLIFARFLDWAEMKLRGPARRAKAVWASLPAAIRLLIGIVGSGLRHRIGDMGPVLCLPLVDVGEGILRYKRPEP